MDSTRNNPPVAVRITRPFPDVDALLAAEANAFTRTGIVLLGAPSKPNGVVLRFELCLQGGAAVMRGEGRVVGYRAPSPGSPGSPGEEGALMLRFTRLDVKSKELLDRAVTLREERRSLAPPRPPPSSARPEAAPPPSERSAEASIPAPPPAAMSVTPAPPQSAEEEAMDVDDADLRSADESDLTAQAPPVALAGPTPARPPEKLPVPTPSPGSAPAPHPIAPPQPATPVSSPEPAPHPRAPEHMPAPQRSPEPKRHASDLVARARGDRESGEFRPTLEPPQRDSALDRLRERKRTSQS